MKIWMQLITAGTILALAVPVASAATGKRIAAHGAKSIGTHHKIGRTNSLSRRGYELGIKIPVPPRTIHYVETDDPAGI